MKVLLRHAVMAVLGVASLSALAQPQVPIEWGPIRLLQNAQGETIAHGVYARGDTIALFGGLEVDNEHQYAMISLTGNNGLSWSPWHTFSFDTTSWGYDAWGACTSHGIYCCATTSSIGRGFYSTTDLGLNWIPPSTSLVLLHITDALGDTIICNSLISNGIYGVTWTADGGHTFAPRREVDMGSGSVHYDYSASDSFLHVMTVSRRRPDWGAEVCHSRGLWNSEGFTPPVSLTANFPSVYTADIEFDRYGTGVVASVVSYDGLSFHRGAITINVTQDNGQSWSGPDTLQPTQSGDPFDIYVCHGGPLWAIVWADSTRSGPFTRGGGWYCFSANHGRSWYPRQQAFGDTLGNGGVGCIDVRPTYLRIYAFMGSWNGIPGNYFFQWEGMIHADTIAPVIESAMSLPDALPADTTVSVWASATDNDSLWLMQVVVRHLLSPDSIVVPLQRQEGHDYSASWTIPFDTSTFFYYYRAEDMWEHAVVWPDTGSYSFHLIRDTVPPVLTDAESLPITLPPDTTVRLAVRATDNDSLVAVAVVLYPPQADSSVVPLQLFAGNEFEALWTVPSDTGLWHYHYRASDRWFNVAVYPDSLWWFRIEPLSTSDTHTLPSSLGLSIYPNPFNPTTTLSFTLPRASEVTLRVINLLGQSVYETDLGRLEAGEHRQIFDGSDLPSGVYLARVEAAGTVQMKKMVLMR